MAPLQVNPFQSAPAANWDPLLCAGIPEIIPPTWVRQLVNPELVTLYPNIDGTGADSDATGNLYFAQKRLGAGTYVASFSPSGYPRWAKWINKTSGFGNANDQYWRNLFVGPQGVVISAGNRIICLSRADGSLRWAKTFNYGGGAFNNLLGNKFTGHTYVAHGSMGIVAIDINGVTTGRQAFGLGAAACMAACRLNDGSMFFGGFYTTFSTPLYLGWSVILNASATTALTPVRYYNLSNGTIYAAGCRPDGKIVVSCYNTNFELMVLSADAGVVESSYTYALNTTAPREILVADGAIWTLERHAGVLGDQWGLLPLTAPDNTLNWPLAFVSGSVRKHSLDGSQLLDYREFAIGKDRGDSDLPICNVLRPDLGRFTAVTGGFALQSFDMTPVRVQYPTLPGVTYLPFAYTDTYAKYGSKVSGMPIAQAAATPPTVSDPGLSITGSLLVESDYASSVTIEDATDKQWSYYYSS